MARKKQQTQAIATRTGERPLTGKQQAFVWHYIDNNCNGIQAAIQAGYKGSYSALGVTAHDNLKNPKIRAEIDARLRVRHASADEVLAKLTEHLRGDIGDFLDPDSLAIDLKKARGKSHLIKKIKTTLYRNDRDDTSVETTEFELYDAQSAADKLARVYGLYKDKSELTIDWRAQLVAVGIDADTVKRQMLDTLRQALPRELTSTTPNNSQAIVTSTGEVTSTISQVSPIGDILDADIVDSTADDKPISDAPTAPAD